MKKGLKLFNLTIKYVNQRGKSKNNRKIQTS